MDDVNINEICLIEEEELIADGDDWVKLNWLNKQSDVNETSPFLDAEKEDLTETDISDGISVITESDTDSNNTNILQVYWLNGNTYRSFWMPETPLNNQANIRNAFVACVIGIITGFILGHSFIAPEVYPNSNAINTESLKTVSHNIVNTSKALMEVKTVLNEIKARTVVDKKIMEHLIGQLFKVDSANVMSNKPTITSESINFDPYSLNQMSQLQMSLYVLSSLAFIYDNSSSLKNEISETLDIVNSTKVFYENLILFNNNTLNEYNSLALKILQHDSIKIEITSKLLFSNLIEKMNKITLSIHNKYTKQKHKLFKKLCDLKSLLPDDEFLKQLTENNQLFKNYDKFCFSNYSSKKLYTKRFEKRNTKKKYIKERIKKIDDTTVHVNYNKENRQKIYDNDRKSSLKNERSKRLNEHNYTVTKFSQNNDKINNTSQLFPTNSKEKISEMINKHTCTKYDEIKHKWIKTKCHKDDSKFIKQSTENNEENNRESANWCTRKSDHLQSIGIQKNMSKDNFDNILMQLQKDKCSLSTNSCLKYNINVSTLFTASSCETENCVVNSNNGRDANNKESVLHNESSEKLLLEKNRPKQKDYFKLSDSSKKTFKNSNKNIKKEKKTFPQNKIKNYISKHTDNYRKSKRSSFNNYATKQDNQDYMNINRQNDNERFYMHKKQRQRDTSDWYFQRVYSRRKARRYAEDMYRGNIKRFWNKYR